MKYLSLLTIIICAIFSGCGAEGDKAIIPDSNGEYLGEKQPGDEAALFAPGIINTSMLTRDFAMTPDKKEIYYTAASANYKYTALLCTKWVEGGWTQPEVVEFANNPDYFFIEPALSPEGKKLFFVSNRPLDLSEGKKEDSDIWMAERTENGWKEPINLGLHVNTEASEYFPSVTESGSIYFTRQSTTVRGNKIFRSKFADGKYQPAEVLPENINTTNTQFNAFVAPDESYIIVPTFGRDDSFGSTDYYISFRDEYDSWTRSVNMGDKINTKSGFEYSASVTPDKKFLFFLSVRDNPAIDTTIRKLTYQKLLEINQTPYNGNGGMYWIDASFIEELRDSILTKKGAE